MQVLNQDFFLLVYIDNVYYSKRDTNTAISIIIYHHFIFDCRIITAHDIIVYLNYFRLNCHIFYVTEKALFTI